MPSNRFSRSFSTLALNTQSSNPPRASTSLGHTSASTFLAVDDYLGLPHQALDHTPSPRPRPPLLSFKSLRSLSGWVRSTANLHGPWEKSPTYSTFSSSSFDNSVRRRSSSEGGAPLSLSANHNSTRRGSQRVSRMPWELSNLHRISVDDDPFAHSPIFETFSGRDAFERVTIGGWLDDVHVEELGQFGGDLTFALMGVGDGDLGGQELVEDLDLGAPVDVDYLLAPTPFTPSIALTPPVEVTADHCSPFYRAQNELLSPLPSTCDTPSHAGPKASDSEVTSISSSEAMSEDEGTNEFDEGDPPLYILQHILSLPATPLPAGLRYARPPACVTPHNSMILDGRGIQTDLTPLLATLLALGDDEGRDLHEPVKVDWSASSISSDSEYGTADDGDLANDMDVDSPLPETPSTPFSAKERLSKFTRSPGLSPSPGRVAFAKGLFGMASPKVAPLLLQPVSATDMNQSTSVRKLSPAIKLADPSTPTPTAPLKLNKRLPSRPVGRLSLKLAALPTRDLPPTPKVVGKENDDVVERGRTKARRARQAPKPESRVLAPLR